MFTRLPFVREIAQKRKYHIVLVSILASQNPRLRFVLPCCPVPSSSVIENVTSFLDPPSARGRRHGYSFRFVVQNQELFFSRGPSTVFVDSFRPISLCFSSLVFFAIHRSQQPTGKYVLVTGARVRDTSPLWRTLQVLSIILAWPSPS